MESYLVSIITPCYNVEKTIKKYLQSILNQTYKNLELIFIDDGSTDETEKIIKEYINEFEQNKIKVKYVYQENAGLGGAINTGLKLVTGDFLCWADPDDFFMPESIEKRLNILIEHPEYDVVSSDAYVYQETDLEHPIKKEAERFEHRFEEQQFEYLLKEESHFCAGCHMVRMSTFDKANPKREIYQARRGQNWQMLLPVYYIGKRYFLDEPLYGYIVYSDSMSSGDVSEEKELFRWNEHEKIIRNTLKQIPLTEKEKEKYDNLITIRYAKKRFFTAIDYRDKTLMGQQYNLLEEKDSVTEELKKAYLRNNFIFWKIFFKILDIVKG